MNYVQKSTQDNLRSLETWIQNCSIFLNFMHYIKQETVSKNCCNLR